MLRKIGHIKGDAWRTLSTLHQNATAVSRNVSTKPTGSFPVQDVLQLQLERLSRSANDPWMCIPFSDRELNLDGFVLHGPFSTTLWNSLRQQHWIPDEQACLLYEIYAAFLESCGWVTRIQVQPLPNKDRPPHLRFRSAGACWAYETDWEDLKLLRLFSCIFSVKSLPVLQIPGYLRAGEFCIAWAITFLFNALLVDQR